MASNPGSRDSSGPPSPTGSNSNSNSNPPSRNSHRHTPSNPSHLRQAHMPPSSPEDSRIRPDLEADGIHPQDHAAVDVDSDATHQHGTIEEPSEIASARTRLLENYDSFKTRPRYQHGYGSFASSYAGTEAETGSFEQARTTLHRPSLGGRQPTDVESTGIFDDYVPDAVTDGLLGRPKKKGTTHWLAERAGIKQERLMYVFEPTQEPRSQTPSDIVSFLFMLMRCVGISSTTFPSPIGYGSTAGGSLGATSSLH